MMEEDLIGRVGGIDALLFPRAMAALGMDHPGRPSLQAMLALLALTFSMLGTLWEDKMPPSGRWIEGSIYFGGAIALLSLFGYAFSASVLFASPVAKGSGLSPYSAILLLSSAVSLLISKPHSLTWKLFISPGPGGYLVRWLLPVFLLLPFLFGLLRAEGERRGWISHESGIAFMALGQFFIGAVMLFWVARNLDRVDVLKKVIRMSCVSKKIFDQGDWVSVEKYLMSHYNIEVTHGMTPEEAETWLREASESGGAKKS